MKMTVLNEVVWSLEHPGDAVSSRLTLHPRGSFWRGPWRVRGASALADRRGQHRDKKQASSLEDDCGLLDLHCVSDVLDMRVLDGLHCLHDDFGNLHLHFVSDGPVMHVAGGLRDLHDDSVLLHFYCVLDLLVMRGLAELHSLLNELLHIHCVSDVLVMRVLFFFGSSGMKDVSADDCADGFDNTSLQKTGTE